MQDAGAPRGQGPPAAQAGPLGRPWVLLLTYVLTSMEFTCLFMQFSILPYLSRRLGLDSVTFGYLQTTFGVLQLLGGPVFGRFADQRGARAAFTVSFLAASALYLLLMAACSPALPGVALLFASRLPALFMHTLPAAQMVVADLSAPEERPAALGRLGLCFGIGIIIGSLLGGTLGTACGMHCPPFVAFVANLLGAVLSFTCIPTSTKGAGTGGQAALAGGPQARVFDLKAISRLLLQPGVLPVFLVKVISGFPSGLFTVMFSIICMDFFQLEAAQAGYLTSFFGVLQMVIQGLVVGRMSNHFSEAALLQASALGFSVVGLAMALMSNILHFCLLMPGLVFSLCTLNVITDSILTKAVSASDTGTMLGLCATVNPLTRTLGPIIGGLLYRSFGVPVFGYVQFAVNFLVLLVLWRQPLPQKTDKVW
ncbi:solute carrier family 22 member 18 [Sturnira hondurensis]|uniref:solute carrier family 22 member 18 n=1 Tax=Sturnira hondurensis TaxID=192404 RepID=UPI001879E4A6|nr:solute carrier family 22 member 18 [Sturnira hondurensis]